MNMVVGLREIKYCVLFLVLLIFFSLRFFYNIMVLMRNIFNRLMYLNVSILCRKL